MSTAHKQWMLECMGRGGVWQHDVPVAPSAGVDSGQNTVSVNCKCMWLGTVLPSQIELPVNTMKAIEGNLQQLVCLL